MAGPFPLEHLRDLTVRALAAAGTGEAAAAAVADALVAAEADGQAGHGLSRVASYADQAASGKVAGHAEPVVTRRAPGAVLADACDGFAYPAIRQGLAVAAEAARETGVAALAVANSHHFGMAGYHVEGPARAGLVALAFGNSPAAIPPWGGARALFGTNPVAFAAPRAGGEPLVIDLSLSKVARGKIMVAAREGRPIPEGWALDADGRPTSDAKAALAGSMLPMGDAKGAALVLMVEVLATCLTGARFGYEASSFFDAEGPPPRVGQLFLLLDPAAFGADGGFARRVAVLCEAILAQPGTRLPGERRYESRRAARESGVVVADAVYADLRRRAGADRDGGG
ncbi:Ldh family oxidoreductase [Azospirillum sp. ST 5-10]|uniref:Ldh family oxidoreductase n=1 Tax=unclassified Azospirillum TaxID=2630922 RepID=UPI003F49BE9D